MVNASGLRRVLSEYVAYYMRSRTHRAQRGTARPATGHTAVSRAHCRHTRSRRPASPLRPRRITAVSAYHRHSPRTAPLWRLKPIAHVISLNRRRCISWWTLARPERPSSAADAGYVGSSLGHNGLRPILLRRGPLRQRRRRAQGYVRSLVSRKSTEAVTTDIHNTSSIRPAHLPIAEVCAVRVHAPVFL